MTKPIDMSEADSARSVRIAGTKLLTWSPDGAIVLLPNLSSRMIAIADLLPFVGLVAIVLHPTVASVFGTRVSAVYVAVTLLLMAPGLRTIHVAPLLAVMAAHVLLVVLLVPVSKIVFVIATYSLFRLLHERTETFSRVFLTVLGVAIFVSILQFLIPSRLLNFHATAVSSPDNWLDRYRPTSIFPAQVYFNQLLLLSPSILLLARISRKSALVMLGIGCAICGSTAGVLSGLLALLIVPRFRLLLAASFLITVGLGAAYYPDAFFHNYSLTDIGVSLKTRLMPVPIDAFGTPLKLETAADRLATSQLVMTEHPTLILVVQFLAMAGVLLGVLVILRARPGIAHLTAMVAAAVGLLTAQILHATQGSLFSCLFIATVAVICWRLVSGYPLASSGDRSSP